MTANTNFATFNPLSNQEGNGAIGSASDDLSNGNTKFNVTNGSSGMAVTIATPPSGGKWYCEFYLSGSVGNYAWVGYYPVAETPEVKGQWSPSSNVTWTDSGLVSVHSMGRYFYTDGQYTDSGATSFTAGDVISIALDLDNGATYFAKNGTYMNSGNPASGASKTGAAPVEGAYSKEYLFAVGSAGSSGHAWTINAGQDSTFGGNLTAGGNTDANGYGDFKYTVPANYKALCSANVPVSSDIDPAGDDGANENPTKQFNTVLWTGDGNNNRSVSGVGFKPDLLWGKIRSGTDDNFIFDSSRGSNRLVTNSTAAAADYSSYWSQFDSDGWTFGNNASSQNISSGTFVGWCWRANGGTTASNSNGSITSTVQSNDKAGFSIITWTASGSNGSIGHGLSAKPDWHLIKKLNGTSGWAVYHKSLGATKYYRLDTNSASSSSQYLYNNTEPDATKIYLGDNGLTNHPSGDTYVCYAWREVEGYSKFGTYTGNGNSFGPFVYTGFRPRMLFIRRYSGTDSSFVIDTARETKNVNGDFLFWDSTQAESDSSLLDILSNGFKIRTTSASINPSGTELIWGAWADVPFKTQNAF